ncbi:MAG: hypothetical protein ACI9AV_002083, partial [Sediminicola sp.]
LILIIWLKKPVKTFGEEFAEKYANTSTEDIQKQILFHLLVNNRIAEKTRSNTNSLIIWLIVIPFLLGTIAIILSF